MPNNNGGGPLKIVSSQFVIKFGEKANGFRMMYLGAVEDNFTITYDEVAGRTLDDTDVIFLFNDEAVSVIANRLPLYTPGASILGEGIKFLDILDTMSDDFWNTSISSIPYDESTAEYDIYSSFASAYMMLDPDWSNDVEPASTPRVQIAQGQSDITRHESYFKEDISPNYKFEDMPKEIKELMELLGVEKPEDISFNLVGNGSLAIFAIDPDPDKLTVIANQYEYQEKAGESIKSYHYTLDDVNENELLNYSKAVVSSAWEPLYGARYFILSSESMKYLDGKALVLH